MPPLGRWREHRNRGLGAGTAPGGTLTRLRRSRYAELIALASVGSVHELILWAGFFGAWLLVVGPVYQAVLELAEEDVEFDRIREVADAVPRPPPVSPWWWLVPPVYVVERRSRQGRHRRGLAAHLSDADFLALRGLVNKATGWLYVAVGGLLIAVKETGELVEGLEWPTWVFPVLIVGMLALALGNAARRSYRDEQRAAQP